MLFEAPLYVPLFVNSPLKQISTDEFFVSDAPAFIVHGPYIIVSLAATVHAPSITIVSPATGNVPPSHLAAVAKLPVPVNVLIEILIPSLC